MRRQLVAVAVAMTVGLVVLVHQFVSSPLLDAVGSYLTAAAALLAAFAILLGLWNVFVVHAGRIARRDHNSWNSAVILVTAIAVFFLVLPSGGSSPASGWFFRYFYRPLEAAFLSLLVFFIATAAYRTLRARTWESGIMVAAALIVLIGTAPASAALSPLLPAVKEWVMNVPMVAGVRGIAIGVALGTVLTALRLLTGIDRPYTGDRHP